MIGMASNAEERIRIAAPYIDEQGIAFLADALAAATKRGVHVDLFDPVSWQPSREAVEAVTKVIRESGDVTRLHLVRAVRDAPFSHLKVMVVDESMAYVGSANITGAGLAGRNLELGVVVRGRQVAVVAAILELYQEVEAHR